MSEIADAILLSEDDDIRNMSFRLASILSEREGSYISEFPVVKIGTLRFIVLHNNIDNKGRICNNIATRLREYSLLAIQGDYECTFDSNYEVSGDTTMCTFLHKTNDTKILSPVYLVRG